MTVGTIIFNSPTQGKIQFEFGSDDAQYINLAYVAARSADKVHGRFSIRHVTERDGVVVGNYNSIPNEQFFYLKKSLITEVNQAYAQAHTHLGDTASALKWMGQSSIGYNALKTDLLTFEKIDAVLSMASLILVHWDYDEKFRNNEFYMTEDDSSSSECEGSVDFGPELANFESQNVGDDESADMMEDPQPEAYRHYSA